MFITRKKEVEDADNKCDREGKGSKLNTSSSNPQSLRGPVKENDHPKSMHQQRRNYGQ